MASVSTRKMFGWYNTKFSTRVTISFGLISFTILLSILLSLSKTFFEDKVVYMLDVIELRSERIATQIYGSLILGRSKISEINSKELSITPLSKLNQSPVSMGLLRLPISSEVFFLKRDIQFHAIWTQKDSLYRIQILPDQLLERLGIPSTNVYWATGKGEWITSLEKTEKEKSEFDRFFAEYSRSGLSRGTSVLKAGKKNQQKILAFQEIRDSNSVLLVVASLDEALKPIRKTVIGISIIGTIMVFFGLLLGSAFIHLNWKPLGQIENLSKLIAAGNYDTRVSYSYQDEISKIFASIYKMAESLQSKEFRFNALRRNLERVAVSTRKMTISADEMGVLSIAGQTLRDSGVVSEKSQIIILLPENLAEVLHLEKRILLFSSADKESLPLDIGGVSIEMIVHHRKNKFVPLAIPNSFGMLLNVKNHEPAAILFGPTKSSKVDQVDENILDAMANSISAALENQILRRESEDKAKIESNLEAASAVQQSLVKQWKSREGVVQGFYYRSAQKTGGDWQGCFFDPITKCLFFYIGDVTGHGIGSALITAVVCGTLNSIHFQRRNSSAANVSTVPTDIIEQLTKTVDFVVAETGQERLCITMILGAIDTRKNKLYYVNCGHPFPFIQKKGEDKMIFLTQNTRQLGLSGPINTSVNTENFGPEDKIFMYTDGLLENHSTKGKTMNKKQIVEILKTLKNAKAQTVVDEIVRKSLSIWDNNPFDDDVSLLLLERTRT